MKVNNWDLDSSKKQHLADSATDTIYKIMEYYKNEEALEKFHDKPYGGMYGGTHEKTNFSNNHGTDN